MSRTFPDFISLPQPMSSTWFWAYLSKFKLGSVGRQIGWTYCKKSRGHDFCQMFGKIFDLAIETARFSKLNLNLFSYLFNEILEWKIFHLFHLIIQWNTLVRRIRCILWKMSTFIDLWNHSMNILLQTVFVTHWLKFPLFIK